MEFGFDDVTLKLRDNLLAFMDEKVYPAEPVFAEQLAELTDHWAWTQAPILAGLRAEAQARGLWNLFLPG
ncbi:MAG TPA: acyl-CoA dehydrogenase, partial [Streptosporangiaceae bacterium]